MKWDGGVDDNDGSLESGVCDGEVSHDASLCGNGVIDEGEDCDGEDFGGLTCKSLGYETGNLVCTQYCTLDTSKCGFACGNGIIDEGEDCDGTNLGGKTCQDLGFGAGVLGCKTDCTWDLTGCPGCGNGVKEEGEWCDGNDFGALSCNGNLACTDDCHLDATGCYPLGLGDGTDGVLEVEGVLNLNETWAAAHTVVSMETDAVTLDASAQGFGSGDEVLLINLQGEPAACEAAGNYEFRRVAAVDGVRVVFVNHITGNYGTGGDNSDLSGQAVMIQRIPHFNDVLVRPGGVIMVDSWNGLRGGVLAMRVNGELRVEYGGLITVAGAGFRGGEGYTSTYNSDGRQGESMCGNPQAALTLPNNGGGGGGYFDFDASDPCGQGGGGGGYGWTGGWADYSSTCRDHGNTNPVENGGQVYGDPALGKAFHGSGGGGGATDDHSQTSGTGGRGGGIMLINAKRLRIAGIISASGMDGTVGSDPNDSGNGGGGSGGTIRLRAGIIEGAGLIFAQGGIGPGSTTAWNNPGGRGGDGRLVIDYQKAGGYLFGRPGAKHYIENLSYPPPGMSGLYYW